MFGSLPGDGAAPVAASEGFSALRSTTVASGSLPPKSLRRNAKKTSAATMIKSKTFDIQASYLMPSIDDATARPTTCREHRAGFFAVSPGWPPDLYGFPHGGDRHKREAVPSVLQDADADNANGYK